MAVLTYLIVVLWQPLASLFFAVIIASALEPMILWFEKRRIYRRISVPFIYLILVAILVLLFSFVIPTVFFETRDLTLDFPHRFEQLRQSISDFIGFEAFPAFTTGSDVITAIQVKLGLGAGDIFSFAMAIFGGALTFFLTIVISFYLALQEKGVEQLLLAVTPRDHQEYISDLWQRVQKKLSRWVGAQFILILFITVTLFPIFWAMGVKYALVIVIIASLLEVIPVLGPVVAGIIILLFVLIQSPALALMALLVYTAIQQVQQHFIVPAVLSRAIGLNPVIIIMLLLAGGTLLGFWGALLAIPFGTAVAEVLADIKRR